MRRGAKSHAVLTFLSTKWWRHRRAHHVHGTCLHLHHIIMAHIEVEWCMCSLIQWGLLRKSQTGQRATLIKRSDSLTHVRRPVLRMHLLVLHRDILPIHRLLKLVSRLSVLKSHIIHLLVLHFRLAVCQPCTSSILIERYAVHDILPTRCLRLRLRRKRSSISTTHRLTLTMLICVGGQCICLHRPSLLLYGPVDSR